MMMTRCNINAREKIDIKEFEYIKYFNNENLITILGQAVSDIAEMGLREIAKTIRNLQSEYKISLGNDIYGNITRIDNALSNIGKELEENKDELENTKKQFENAKIDVKIPFDKENELKEKSTRLDRINALLKLDEKENIIMEDDEKSEDDNLKSQDYDKDPIR